MQAAKCYPFGEKRHEEPQGFLPLKRKLLGLWVFVCLFVCFSSGFCRDGFLDGLLDLQLFY